MRKICSTIFVLLLVVSTAFAYYEKPRLLFGTGNDKFTYGISKNEDDDLSFSGIVEFDYENFKINLNMEAFTDRGSRPNDVFRTGRLDIMSLDAGFYNSIRLSDIWSAEIDTSIGVGMSGNLYFDTVQNLHHKNVGVATAEIPYDWDAVRVAPIAGLGFAVNYDFSVMRFSAQTSYRYTYNLYSEKLASFAISTQDDTFTLNLGYRKNRNFSESLTLDASGSTISGPFLSFAVDAIPFVMKWSFYPQSMFGYGTFLVDALPFIRGESVWEKSDVYFIYDLSSFYDMELLNAGISVPITDTVSAVGEVKYVSGFPVSESETRVQRNYALYQTGVSYSPIKGFISPYLEAQLGLGLFQINYLNNTNPDSNGSNISFPTRAIFIADLSFGVKIFPEGFLSFGNNTYQLQIYCGTHIVPWNKNFTQAIENDNAHSSSWIAGVLGPYVGAGVSIGIDVPNV